MNKKDLDTKKEKTIKILKMIVQLSKEVNS